MSMREEDEEEQKGGEPPVAAAAVAVPMSSAFSAHSTSQPAAQLVSRVGKDWCNLASNLQSTGCSNCHSHSPL
jgi:hypothetical protein